MKNNQQNTQMWSNTQEDDLGCMQELFYISTAFKRTFVEPSLLHESSNLSYS